MEVNPHGTRTGRRLVLYDLVVFRFHVGLFQCRKALSRNEHSDIHRAWDFVDALAFEPPQAWAGQALAKTRG